MGGFVSRAATRGCRGPHTWIAAALALLALAVPFAGSASAQPAATRLDLTGMSAPAGVAVTPDGEIWVSDAAMGICHATRAGLVQDEFCAPEPAVPPVTPTRPSGTGQIAFAPATDDFYVAEGTSGGSGVWRMHWAAGAITSATKIYDSGADRIEGLAVTGSGAVVFSGKSSGAIRRIAHPETIDSPAAATAETVGHAASGGAPSLATLGEIVYLADGGQITRLDPGATFPTAVPVAGQPLAAGVSALAADPARGVVYAGTATPDLTDAVLSVSGDVLSPAAYDRGYTNITAMAVAPSGALLVAQDPNGALSPSADPLGMAELWRKAAGPLVPPAARLTATPAATQRSSAVSFAFDVPTGGTDTTSFACTLDGQAVDCPAMPGTATGAYVRAAQPELAEGVHTFSVRAANVPVPVDADFGPAATSAFAIDRTAPSVTIDAPSSHTAPGGALRLYFSADSAGVDFTCQLDDGAPAPCDPPADLLLAPGEHTIAVRATDAAGNESAPAIWTAAATPALPAPEPGAPAAVTDTTPAGAVPAAPASPSQATPAVTVASEPTPRIEIDVPCVEVSPSRAAAGMRMAGRRAVVRFRAPAMARYAKVTLRRTRTRRGAETVAYARVVRAGAPHVVHVALTRGQRRLVRGGRARLAIAYGTCRTQVGQWKWITEEDR